MALVHGAYGGADGVVFLACEQAGHFGRFATDERAACSATAFGYAFDELPRDVDVEFAAAVAVEEEEGVGALYDKVVHVHGDEVDADSVVDVHGVGDFEFGADAVDGADQDGWRCEAGGGEVEEAAETADGGVGAGAGSGADRCFYLVDEGVAG